MPIVVGELVIQEQEGVKLRQGRRRPQSGGT